MIAKVDLKCSEQCIAAEQKAQNIQGYIKQCVLLLEQADGACPLESIGKTPAGLLCSVLVPI